MNLLSSLQSILTYPTLQSPDVHGNPVVFCQKVNNSLITKSPFKVVSYGGSLVSQLHNTLSCSCLLRVPHCLQNISKIKNCLPHLWQNMINCPINLTILNCLMAFWIQTDCGRNAWHMTNYFFAIFKIFFWISR